MGSRARQDARQPDRARACERNRFQSCPRQLDQRAHPPLSQAARSIAMSTEVNARAGKPAGAGARLDVAKLIAAYYNRKPDPSVPAERVAFGTSGHRGTSFDGTFNEAHVVAITAAICRYRRK